MKNNAIKNAVKCINARSTRTETKRRLESLGILTGNPLETIASLKKKFNSFSKKEQEDILELMGGVFQKEVLKNLLCDKKDTDYTICARKVIKNLYEKGMKAKEIARIVGLPAGTVAALQAHNTMKST